MWTTTLAAFLLSALVLGTPVRRDDDNTVVGITKDTTDGFCLDVTNGTFVDGTPVQYWTCNHDHSSPTWRNQDWSYKKNGDGFGAIYIVAPSGETFCLDATDTPDEGKPLIINKCDVDNPAPRFKWQFDNVWKSAVGDYCFRLSTLPEPWDPAILRPCSRSRGS